jgi:NADPH-dependent curcumin reductase CurA
MTLSTPAHQIVLAARPDGKPKPSDFRMEEFTPGQPAKGEMLLQVQYLSLDPYMRGRMNEGKSYVPPLKLGGVMDGETIATVVISKNPLFQEGDIVAAPTGWCTHALSDGANVRKIDPGLVPVTMALGVLGMPGFTAYAGLLTIGQPKIGETVVVAAASGPVGSLVGQIAKIKGARVVGIAGSSLKCGYIRNEFGFDAVVDHQSANFPAELAEACPNGVDIYFELVDGEVWQAVLPLLNKFARVPVCGLIAQYNGVEEGDGTDHLPDTMREILSRSLTLRGFIISEFADQRPNFMRDVSAWIAEGRVRYRNDIVDGLENAPEAFMGMLEGHNFGKLIIRMNPSTRE